MEKLNEDKVTLDNLIGGEEINENAYVDMFSKKEEPIQIQEPLTIVEKEPVNTTDPKEFYEDIENKKRFIKHLNPEYKANVVYDAMFRDEKNYPHIPRYGHEKRIFLRKLIREAKKGRLDRYFLKK